jgi:uncharacterized protein YdhG (YjbR/CyaY superfamily)
MNKPDSVDEYITGFPEDIQQILTQIRKTIKLTVPEAEEIISYGMPSFKLNGKSVWFAANTRFIGFYPKINGTDALKKILLNYKGTKGSVHFPFDKPIPYDLITEMVKFRFG